ncbi:hypothetical protein YC2023_033647 [Brassica napus]
MWIFKLKLITTKKKNKGLKQSVCVQLGAEFVGTLILIFAGTATAIVNQKTDGAVTLIGCAASAGLAVMIVILSTGHISGAHLNPAVTISFAALKHFPWKHCNYIFVYIYQYRKH